MLMTLRSKTAGYSLLEVMIALVIFSIIMLGTSSMLLATKRGTESSGETSAAYYETQRIIEDIHEEIRNSTAAALRYEDATADNGEFILSLRTTTGTIPVDSLGQATQTYNAQNVVYKTSVRMYNSPEVGMETRVKIVEGVVKFRAAGTLREVSTRTIVLIRG